MNTPLASPLPTALPTIAILGRPNVGKSTLFNILSQTDQAITHATAGTTRDIRKVPAKLDNLHFMLLDTAGIESQAKGLQADLNQLALAAAEMADILVLVLDGQAGALPADHALHSHLRKFNKPLIILVNKGDTAAAQDNLPIIAGEGFPNPLLFSAAHRMGLSDLHDRLSSLIASSSAPLAAPSSGASSPLEAEINAHTTLPSGPLKIAILGRPNVGKSTLVNTLLGANLMLTGPTAGLTREAIRHTFSNSGQAYEIIDTPGLRKPAKVTENLEELSVNQAIEAAKSTHVIIMLVDASLHNIGTGQWQVFEQQDAKIATTIMNLGKPIVVALSKWDAVADPEECLKDTQIILKHRLHTIAEPLAIPISSINKRGLKPLLQAVNQVHIANHTQHATSFINKHLGHALAKRSLPLSASGRAITLKFAMQINTSPPHLVLVGTRTTDMPDNYLTFLRNQLGSALGFQHIPLKLTCRKTENPYATRTNPNAHKNNPNNT